MAYFKHAFMSMKAVHLALLIGFFSVQSIAQEETTLASQEKLIELKKESANVKSKEGNAETNAIAIPGDDDEGERQSDPVNNDISARLNAKKSITAETTNLIGEEIDLSSGSLGFSNVDVSLPGNSSIDVAIRRRFVSGAGNYLSDYSFGNWQLDIPRIETDVIAGYGNWDDGRECTGDLSPHQAWWGGVMIDEWAYWNGVSLHVPGKTQEKVLNNYGNITSSVNHPLITKSNWRISCIDRVNANGEKVGEGFVAQSPDGLTYTFSQPRGVRRTPLSISPNAPYYKSLMLVTKVEDRFGHSATYNYDSAGKLTSISANDGRVISLVYKSAQYGSSVISTVTANNRTWTYDYSGGYGGRSLSKVIRPDTKEWVYNLSNFNKKTTQGVDLNTNCLASDIDDNNSRTGTVTHPNGVTGTFVVKATIHGRTNVTAYAGYKHLYSRCNVSFSLQSKSLSGSGVSALNWQYSYSQNKGSYTSGGVSSETTPDGVVGSVPSNIDPIGNYKTTTVVGPDTSKSVHYFNRDFSSHFEGKEVARDSFDINDGDLLQRIERNYAVGTSVGYSELNRENTKPIRNQILLSFNKTILYKDSVATNYSTEYSDWNKYGVARKTLSYQGIKSDAVKRYTKTGFDHNTSKWILNQPTTSGISQEDANYVIASETTYYAKNHASYPFLPYQQKSFGVWQKQFSEYHIADGEDDVYKQKGNVKKIEFNQHLIGGDEEWNALNRFNILANYKRGQPQLITVPNRNSKGTLSSSSVVDNNGWVTSTTDVNKNTTGYSYDSLGRMASIKAPEPKSGEPNWADILFTRTYIGSVGAKQLVQTIKRCTLTPAKTGCTDTAKITIATLYDGLLRARLVTTIADSTTVYQKSNYNGYNKIIFQSFPSEDDTETLGSRFEYDGLQRVIKQSVSNGGFAETEYLTGNKIKITDAGKNVNNTTDSTTTTYLAYGAPSYKLATKIESPEKVTTDISINVLGNITSIKQSGLNGTAPISDTEYRAYDSQQRLCQLERGDVGTTVLAHNDLGEVTWQAQGQTAAKHTVCNSSVTANSKVSFSYDNLGSQRTIRYDDGTPTRTFGVDNNGNVTSISGGGFSQAYSYNSVGLLKSETLVISGRSGGLTLSYGYDTLGSLASLTYPGSEKPIAFAPNGFGQPTQAIRTKTDDSTEIFVKAGAEYHPSGMVKTFTYGNNVIHKTDINTRLLPEQISDKFGTTNVVNLNFKYDNSNNIIELKNALDGGDIYSLTSLSYDGLNRLASTKGGHGIGSSALTYDGLGNIRTYSNDSLFKESNLTYHYKANFLLKDVETTNTSTKVRDFSATKSYDVRGNVLKNGNAGRTFTYNLANQMTRSGSNSYVYDGYNRRVKTQSSKGMSYSFYSQSGQLLYRETAQGGINYIFFGSKLVAKEGTGVKEPDENLKETSIANYKPFGDIIELGADGTGYLENRDEVGYTGHKFDTDIELSYMQARYYDPVIGRFYSNDPIGVRDVHSFNRYAYANNNPYKYTDPFGQSVKKVIKDEVKRQIKNAKARGRRKALKDEKKELEETGESRSNLTPERQQELKDTGKLKNMDGHHEPSVSSGETLKDKIKIAQDPKNIKFLEKKDHMKIHKNNGGTRVPIGERILGIMVVLDPTRGATPPSNPFSNECADCV